MSVTKEDESQARLGRSRQSSMKLAPVNGVNVYKPVFVSDMDVFSTCFNFRTIYQVGIQ